jgi:hypothetical protein
MYAVQNPMPKTIHIQMLHKSAKDVKTKIKVNYHLHFHYKKIKKFNLMLLMLPEIQPL